MFSVRVLAGFGSPLLLVHCITNCSLRLQSFWVISHLVAVEFLDHRGSSLLCDALQHRPARTAFVSVDSGGLHAVGAGEAPKPSVALGFGRKTLHYHVAFSTTSISSFRLFPVTGALLEDPRLDSLVLPELLGSLCLGVHLGIQFAVWRCLVTSEQ